MNKKSIIFLTLITIFFINSLQASAPVPQQTFACNAIDSKLSDISPDLITKSHYIIQGYIDVPDTQILSNIASNSHDYIEITMKMEKILKGEINKKKNSPIRYYTRESWYKPCSKTLIQLDNKRVMVFLVQSGEEYYFAGHTPNSLLGIKEGMIEKISKEIERQNKILATPEKKRTVEEEVIYQKVKSLIEASLIADTQEESLKQIEELGLKAVPSIILLMDDYRPLPHKRISLVNKAENSFEGIRHYGPKVLVDALAAILNQITGNSYGSIYNGATDSERQRTVNGWKIYSSTLQ